MLASLAGRFRFQVRQCDRTGRDVDGEFGEFAVVRRACSRMRWNAAWGSIPYRSARSPLACSMSRRVVKAVCSCSARVRWALTVRCCSKAMVATSARARASFWRGVLSGPGLGLNRLTTPMVCPRSRMGMAWAER